MRIVKVDALRGVAAMVVVLQHSMEQVLNHQAFSGWSQDILTLFFKTGMNFGRFGVAMFFLISGFVIPFSFRGERPLLGFAISRVFRLYPAYWVSLGLAVAVIAITQRLMPPMGVVAANITMFQKFAGVPDVVGAYWTLAIELVFYGLCMALFRLRLLNHSRALALVIVGLLGIGLATGGASALLGRHLPAGVPLHLAMMFLGTVMRRGWYDGDPFACKVLPGLLCVLIVAVPSIQWLSYPDGSVSPAYARPLAFTMGYFVAIAVFVVSLRWSRIAFGPAAAWLGTISYSVYVLHGPLLDLFTTFVRPDTPARAAAFLAAMVLSSVVIADLVHKRVEQPGIRAGRKALARLMRAPNSSLAAS